jgi:hypothetical protein
VRYQEGNNDYQYANFHHQQWEVQLKHTPHKFANQTVLNSKTNLQLEFTAIKTPPPPPRVLMALILSDRKTV